MSCFSIYYLILASILLKFFAKASTEEGKHHQKHKNVSAISTNGTGRSWVLNVPPDWGHSGQLIDVRSDDTEITINFPKFVESSVRYTDGETVDIVEHFFWGKRGGLVIELGAVNGLPSTSSNSYQLEKQLGWKRLLIEGNPKFHDTLRTKSPESFSVGAAICKTSSTVHYATRDLVGGIVEMMNSKFLSEYYPHIYFSTKPPGNISSINLTDPSIAKSVKVVPCIPLHLILREARVKHANVFILDTEGGELNILQTINWDNVIFDVLCVETEDSYRFKGYTELVRSFLATKGYTNVTGVVGRNMWFTHNSFQPTSRPGLDPKCYNRYKSRPRVGWERVFFWQKQEPKCNSVPYAKIDA